MTGGCRLGHGLADTAPNTSERRRAGAPLPRHHGPGRIAYQLRARQVHHPNRPRRAVLGFMATALCLSAVAVLVVMIAASLCAAQIGERSQRQYDQRD